MTVITVLYALIGLAIRRSTHLSRAGSDASDQSGVPLGTTQSEAHQLSQQHQQRRGGVLKMLGRKLWLAFH